MFITSSPVCRTAEGVQRLAIGTAAWRTAGTGRMSLEGIDCQEIGYERKIMLSLTKLLTGDAYYGDDLRYTPESCHAPNGVAVGRGPVVSWNCTRTCNLKCRHCYANSEGKRYAGELLSLIHI